MDTDVNIGASRPASLVYDIEFNDTDSRTDTQENKEHESENKKESTHSNKGIKKSTGKYAKY